MDIYEIFNDLRYYYEDVSKMRKSHIIILTRNDVGS